MGKLQEITDAATLERLREQIWVASRGRRLDGLALCRMLHPRVRDQGSNGFFNEVAYGKVGNRLAGSNGTWKRIR
jgi:hypothetical protein